MLTAFVLFDRIRWIQGLHRAPILALAWSLRLDAFPHTNWDDHAEREWGRVLLYVKSMRDEKGWESEQVLCWGPAWLLTFRNWWWEISCGSCEGTVEMMHPGGLPHNNIVDTWALLTHTHTGSNVHMLLWNKINIYSADRVFRIKPSKYWFSKQ